MHGFLLENVSDDIHGIWKIKILIQGGCTLVLWCLVSIMSLFSRWIFVLQLFEQLVEDFSVSKALGQYELRFCHNTAVHTENAI